MAILRCSICAISWPMAEEFKDCPGCGEKTDGMQADSNMDLEEARSQANLLRFERFYADWDESQPEARLSTDAASSAKIP